MWEPLALPTDTSTEPVPGTPADALAELLTAIARRQHEHRQRTADRLTAVLDTGLLPAELAEGLSARDLARARIRLEHLMEIETGFRSGSRYWARPHEPRPAFDLVTTSLGERRRTKALELGAMSEAEATGLGLESVSERTLKRMAARYRESGPAGLADGRWTRRAGGHPSVTAELEEAIRAVREQCLRRSRISMASRERLVHQYVREVFPGREVWVPHRTTLARVWREWFGPDGVRQRYVRSAAAVPAPAGCRW
ncbi:hypothetical protein [Streptomyces sp. NPDC002785]|uniref:hypothetical protein n=1 Tax=Streptomyces sp. NPDC002785 TaxID=3154543 RepID=UPI00333406BD